MAFADVLNPQGYERLNLFGLSSTSLYFGPSKVTSNPDILEVASSDIFQSAKSYYKITLQAGERYSFFIAGNTKDNSTLIADSSLVPVVLNSEINDGNDPGYWDRIDDFVPTASGTYYIKPTWLTNTASVTVYKWKPVVTDVTAPTVTTFTPADEASSVATNSNIVLNFSEAIARGTGNIVLKSGTGTVIATYDAATSSNITISGSTLSLNPSADLAFSTGYSVEFAAGSVKDLAGNSFAGSTSYNFTTESSPIIFGGTGNDTLSGGSGKSIDGLTGIDTVSYSGNHGSIIRNPNGTWTIGTDTLTNVERLQFSDKKIALDLTPDGNAGKALEFIGMMAHSLVKTPTVVGTILSIFDQGKSMKEVCQLAIDVGLTGQLAGSTSNLDLAKLVFRNVVGSEASAGDAANLASFIQGSGGSMAQADFLTAVAQLDLNIQHIGLVGLQNTGVEYIL